MSEDRHCPTCGAQIVGTRHRIYCGPRCRPSFIPIESTGKCHYCKAELVRRSGEAATNFKNRRHCGFECYWAKKRLKWKRRA